MEKRVPHCELSAIRELIAAGKVRSTYIASTSARKLGIDPVEMVAVVFSLSPADFYKPTSTTEFGKMFTALRQDTATSTSS